MDSIIGLLMITGGVLAVTCGLFFLPTQYRMKVIKDMSTGESTYIGQYSKFCILWRRVDGLYSDPQEALAKCHKHQSEKTRKFEVRYISPLRGIK